MRSEVHTPHNPTQQYSEWVTQTTPPIERGNNNTTQNNPHSNHTSSSLKEHKVKNITVHSNGKHQYQWKPKHIHNQLSPIMVELSRKPPVQVHWKSTWLAQQPRTRASAQNNEENEGTPQCEGSNNTFDPNHLTTRSSQPTSHRKTNLHLRVTYSISLNVTTSLYDECTWTPSRKINYQEFHMAEKMRQIIIPNSHLSKNWSNKILSIINIYQYFIGIDSPDDRENDGGTVWRQDSSDLPKIGAKSSWIPYHRRKFLALSAATRALTAVDDHPERSTTHKGAWTTWQRGRWWPDGDERVTELLSACKEN